MEDLTKENQAYWINRAKGYSEVNKEELSGIQKDTWSQFLINQIDGVFSGRARSSIKILDVGAGPGFISIILARAGYQVFSLDFAQTMIEEAKHNAGQLSQKISFVQGDATNLVFEDATFDVVFSRNLTWNLENPQAAYISWLRVLKPAGLMLVFDANWYTYLVDDKKRDEYNRDRVNVKNHNLEDYNLGDNFDQMERIAMAMPLTKKIRPQWDKEYLSSINAGIIDIVEDVGSVLYSDKERINYSSTPLFMVRVIKGN